MMNCSIEGACLGFTLLEAEDLKPPVKISSGTGSGHEILCQGFNWESHKSGRWYLELQEKAELLSSLGFTVVWLPPPTESVSPEGYMPKDLYNLNSRYVVSQPDSATHWY
nr:alpha-amylase 3, chloroplastic [Ipomoea batatas]